MSDSDDHVRDGSEEHIASLRARLTALGPGDTAEHTAARIQLAGAVGTRHSQTGSRADLNETITLLRAVAAPPDPRGAQDAYRFLLARHLLARAFNTRVYPPGVMPAELETPAQVAQAMARPEGRRDLAEAMDLLAAVERSPTLYGGDRASGRALTALLSQLAALGGWGPPAESADAVTPIIETIPAGSPNRELLTFMASFMKGFADLKLGKAPDLAGFKAALEGLPPGHPMFPVAQHALVGLTTATALQCGSPEGLAEATEQTLRLLDDLGPDHPLRGDTLLNLALALGAQLQFDPAAVPVDPVLAVATEVTKRPEAPPDQVATAEVLLGNTLIVRAIEDGAVGAVIDEASAHFRRASALASEGSPLHGTIRSVMGLALSLDGAIGGDLQTQDAAQAYYASAETWVDSSAPSGGDEVVMANRAAGQIAEGDRSRDIGLVDEGIAALERVLDRLPPERLTRAYVLHHLGRGQQTKGWLCDDAEGVLRGLATIEAAAEAIPEDHPDRVLFLGSAGQARLARAVLTRDLDQLDQAVATLRHVASASKLRPFERVPAQRVLGEALARRNEFTGDVGDLDEAIERFEQARREAEQYPATGDPAGLLMSLAEARHRRAGSGGDDVRQAIATGMEGLRAKVGRVLLQTGAHRGLAVAQRVFSDANQVALWCLADGQEALAVEALELGRGLVLYSATVSAEVSELLRAAGETALADAWEAEPSSDGEPAWNRAHHGPVLQDADQDSLDHLKLPSDLRRRVLATLLDSPLASQLLSPPSAARLASALTAADTDALVYLLPTTEHGLGRGVLVRSNGEVHEIGLPRLAVGPSTVLASYEVAHQRALKSSDEQVQRDWRTALDRLCEWAWPAAMEPLLRSVATWDLGRVPRLVLVPSGALGLVPWHAARVRTPDGSHRYAIEDVAFSYAASGHQFLTSTTRERRPLQDNPVLVVDPSRGAPGVSPLLGANLEGSELRERYYLAATYLGRPKKLASGSGTPDEILARLPGGTEPASMLHLGCHARVQGSSADSHLLLANAEVLPASQILRQAEKRPRDEPGGLITLAACTSDLSDVDHDEALTLATALLSAGAAAVVGAKWAVHDTCTALLMVMFHHFLNYGYERPADALRQAQLWMLDPHRRTLEALDPILAAEATTPRLTEVSAWAAFSHQGH